MKVHTSNIRIIMPEVVKAHFEDSENGFPLNHSSDWGWTPLIGRFSQIMRLHFVRHKVGEWTEFGLGENTANDAFGRYGLLNCMIDGLPFHTWTNMRDELTVRGARPMHPPIDPNTIHIPSGWVNQMIDAAERGIIRVTCKKIKPENISRGIMMLIGHDIRGNKFQVINNGGRPASYEYRLVAPSEWLYKYL